MIQLIGSLFLQSSSLLLFGLFLKWTACCNLDSENCSFGCTGRDAREAGFKRGSEGCDECKARDLLGNCYQEG